MDNLEIKLPTSLIDEVYINIIYIIFIVKFIYLKTRKIIIYSTKNAQQIF